MSEPPHNERVINTYVPEQRVLTRLTLLAILMVIMISAVLLGTQTTSDHALHHIQQRGPAHFLFISLIIAYLLWLNKAMFHTLGRGHRIEETGNGLRITTPDDVTSLSWEEIERIEFGEVYLTIRAQRRSIEIPFIPKVKQRELYRKHFRVTGLTPNQRPMRPCFPRKP